jgi:hypothetical protein
MVFGLIGGAHAIGLLLQVLVPLAAVLRRDSPLFGSVDAVHFTWTALLRVGSLILRWLYLTRSVRRRCDVRFGGPATAAAVGLAGAVPAILLMLLLLGHRAAEPTFPDDREDVSSPQRFAEPLVPRRSGDDEPIPPWPPDKEQELETLGLSSARENLPDACTGEIPAAGLEELMRRRQERPADDYEWRQ